MLEILQGEFFWGIMIGLLLSFLGGWTLAKFTVTIQQANLKKTMVKFCVDTITNIQSIVSEMDSTRDRAGAIYHDFLMLIEVEIQIYGRNREHLIHLPDEERNLVRQFMNSIAIKRADVTNHLDQFYKLGRLADQTQVEGRAPEAQRIRDNSNISLSGAQTAADRLTAITKESAAIIDRLSKLE